MHCDLYPSVKKEDPSNESGDRDEDKESAKNSVAGENLSVSLFS